MRAPAAHSARALAQPVAYAAPMMRPNFGMRAARRWVKVGLGAWVLALASLAACGGATTDGASTARDDAQAYCNRAEELGCDIIDDCPEFIADARAESAAKQCAREFDSALRCLSRSFSSCQDDPDKLCPTELQNLARCDEGDDDPPRADCSFGTGGGADGYTECRLECGSYEASCTGEGQSWSCSCTAGPQLGERILANCDNLPSIAESACR